MAVGTKIHRDVSVLSVDEQVSGVLKGRVELLHARSLATRVGSAETKVSSLHFIFLKIRSQVFNTPNVAPNVLTQKIPVIPSDG